MPADAGDYFKIRLFIMFTVSTGAIPESSFAFKAALLSYPKR